MKTSSISDLNALLDTATAALQKAEERTVAGQLALEVMHEIRNPLEALGNFIYLAFQQATDSDSVRKYMLLAEEQMTTLKQITDETLGFASPPTSLRSIDMTAIADAALRIHQRKIDSKQIHLVKEFPKNLVAKAHTGQILQVLSNVITNALDALPVHGTLRVRIRKHKGEVHFVIADNGPGIKNEHRKEVFQPFFTTKEDRGTGLGLALSKSIVERHHGKILMRSSVHPEKSGTTFRISLPAQELIEDDLRSFG